MEFFDVGEPGQDFGLNVGDLVVADVELLEVGALGEGVGQLDEMIGSQVEFGERGEFADVLGESREGVASEEQSFALWPVANGHVGELVVAHVERDHSDQSTMVDGMAVRAFFATENRRIARHAPMFSGSSVSWFPSSVRSSSASSATQRSESGPFRKFRRGSIDANSRALRASQTRGLTRTAGSG